MEALNAVKEVSLSQIKRGSVYRNDKRVTTEFGYSVHPGDLYVEQTPVESAYGSKTLSVVNLNTGKKEFLYPAPDSLQLANITRSAGMKARIFAAQRKYPGTFAKFGSGMSLGTDPELFSVDERGMLLPAFTFLGDKAASDKRGYRPAGYHREANTVPYWDGFQGEFAVHPYSCIAHLTDCIQGGFVALYNLAKAHNPGATVVATPVLPVPAIYLQDGEQKHVELGCMPSENVYGDEGLHVHNGRELPIRFAGFHMHFAVDKARLENIPDYVRMIDKLCGVMSVVALQGFEDPIRRRYYGLAGEHRLPKHGLEWRVLSSAVAWHPASVHLHFNIARAAIQLAEAGLAKVWQGSEEEAREVVNSLDIDRAKKVLLRNRDLYVGCMGNIYAFKPDHAEAAFDKLIMPGFKEHIELNMETNWLLKRGAWADHSNGASCQFQDYAKRTLKWPGSY